MSLETLAPLIWLMIPVFAMLVVQVLKFFSRTVDEAPAWAKQVLGVIFAAAGTLLTNLTGVPVPPELLSIDQGTAGQIIAWLFTALGLGSATVGLHSVKKATVG